MHSQRNAWFENIPILGILNLHFPNLISFISFQIQFELVSLHFALGAKKRWIARLAFETRSLFLPFAQQHVFAQVTNQQHHGLRDQMHTCHTNIAGTVCNTCNACLLLFAQCCTMAACFVSIIWNTINGGICSLCVSHRVTLLCSCCHFAFSLHAGAKIVKKNLHLNLRNSLLLPLAHHATKYAVPKWVANWHGIHLFEHYRVGK